MTGRGRSATGTGATVWRAADLADYDGPLLLDTHIWIWYLEGDATSMDHGVAALLERAGATNQLRVSDISYWEVAVKTAKGKLTLAMDSGIWLHRAEQAPGIQFHPIDRDTLLLSTRLTGAVHNDPADRILIATAQLNSIPLVTADESIVEYARENRGTPVVDARGRRR